MKLQPLAQSDFSTVVFEYEPIKERAGTYQSEAELEREFIDTLKAQGYEYVKFSDFSSLKDNLRKQIEKLNDVHFNDAEWDRFYVSVIANKREGVRAKAQKIQKDYIQFFEFDDGRGANIKLIDKNNIHKNILQVINQYAVKDGIRHNRYDVSVLVNGLPLVHIELKRRGVALKEAFNQIKRYAKESFFAEDGIFEYVQIFVISNGVQSKYYSNTTRETHTSGGKNTFEFTSYWADSTNKVILDLMDFAKTFFSRHTLLNILTRYCVFTSEENLLVMRPYQIVAAERIINQIQIAHNARIYGAPHGGYIWHTTGSGKTLTSFKTAILATELEYIHKVLFVVDRKDLDYQTMKEYDRFQQDSANSNANTKILQKQLEDPQVKIIITNIQKLDKFIKGNKGHSIFDTEIVIIFDECHRSQLGSMHRNITRSFKKYHLFGFTGTPIFAENCDSNTPLGTTEQKFGKALHKYTIVDAIADNNVLRFRIFYHNTLKAKEEIEDKSIQGIDSEKAILDERRIGNVVKYILENFAHITKHHESYTFNRLDNIKSLAKNFKKVEEKRSEVSIKGFNSILACSNIDAVKKYYQAFKAIEHQLKVATIFSYASNEDVDGLFDESNEGVDGLDQSSREFLENAMRDYNALFATNYDTSAQSFQSYYKDVSMRMKNREIDILIVANMFLTGFDATTLNTLWVDKNLKYHGLIQAFSRTNRILNSVKTFGNIVCFRDLEENLHKALKLFGNKDSGGIVLLRSYEDYYYGYSEGGREYQGYQTLIERLLSCFPLGERIASEKKQKDFIELYGKILKLRNILECYDEFQDDCLISPKDLQDYQGMYLDLYKEKRGEKRAGKEEINDDLIFEIELIRQTEINIDYILQVITEYAKLEDKQQHGVIKQNLETSMNASLEMRNKKDLIMDFVENINLFSDDVIRDFEEYMNHKRDEEFRAIIAQHKLPEKEAYRFVKKAFEKGDIDFKGDEFPKLLPKGSASFFSKSANRSETKERIAIVLHDFFERFYGISSGFGARVCI